MPCSVARESLLRAVKLAAAVVPRNSPKSALEGILLTQGDGCLLVKATDTEASICIAVTIDGKFDSPALPDAQKIVQTLTEADCQSLELHKEGDELSLRSMFAETVLKDCDSPDAYPYTVQAEAKVTLVLNAQRLSTALKRVAYCCSDESARYALTGVKIERGDGKLTLIATDGRRMAVEELDCPSCEAVTDTIVVPEKTIRLLLNASRSDEGEITIGFQGNYVNLSVDGVTINAKTVEGRYPAWREVFPKKHDHKIPLNTGTLLTMTRQASVMMTEETRGIEYTFDKGKLYAKSQDPYAGKAAIQLPIAYDRKPFSLVMAGDLVRDMLAAWPGDTELEACFVGNNTVAEFRFPEGHRYVIVPLTRAEKKEAA